MTETIRYNAAIRNRQEPWFAKGAEERTTFNGYYEPADSDYEHIAAHEAMFVPAHEVIAHMIFALVTNQIGGRLTLTRLESRFGPDGFDAPRLITEPCLRVDYVNTGQGVAVVTDETQSRVIQIRLDSITEIEPNTESLTLDEQRVPVLEATTLSSPGWEKSGAP